MTPRIGLYYPYVHFRSDEWLKAAALYWPRLARVVPARYPVADSATVLALADGLDFVVDVDPAPAVGATSALLAEAVDAHANALRERYAPVDTLSRAGPVRPGPAIGGQVCPARGAEPPVSRWAPPVWRENPDSVLAEVAWLHPDKTAVRLRDALHRAGLSADHRGPWVGVHPEVAWVYMCALAERLAATNRLEPATDQLAAHSATHGWTADRMAAALLGRPEPVPRDLAVRIGLLAVQVVVPRGLAGVAVEKIVRVRRKYGAEFEAFHATMVDVAGDLATELDEVADPAALDAYLRMTVAARFQRPLAELTAALRGAGLDTVLSAATMKFELPAALASTGGGLAAGQPLVAGTAAAAFGLLTVARSRQARRAVIAPPAASFLWNIDRCTARGLLKRVLS